MSDARARAVSLLALLAGRALPRAAVWLPAMDDRSFVGYNGCAALTAGGHAAILFMATHRLGHRLAAVWALAAVVALASANAAAADSRYPIERTHSRSATFNISGCGATDTATLTMPTRASRIDPYRPRVGARVPGDASGETFARITSVKVARADGRRVVEFTAEGSDAACRAPDPNCEIGLDEGCHDVGRSEPVWLAARYTTKVRVYVRGTGRGGRRSYKPRVLPFGFRSAIIGLRWRGWGRSQTVGYGRVEFNNCMPSCAQARPSYYPVRVVLSRVRRCGSVAQYRRLAFRYTTSRRPPGLPASYRENFSC